MNEPTMRLEVRPEVSAFVDQVRARLGDLHDEEREELVGGLEADIAELVSDGGSVSELGDPRAYADELRSAAGLERPVGGSGAPRTGLLGVRRPRRAPGERVDVTLDRARSRWFELVDVPALKGPWEILEALRPLWWVVRAWVALELVDYVFGNGGNRLDLVPTLGPPLFDLLLLAAAIVVSVQIGRGRVWPGRRLRGAAYSRLLLLGLNAVAVLALMVALPQVPTQDDISHAFDDGHASGSGGGGGSGLVHRGRVVHNVFPFDAQGRPLTGVQLFDENGSPLSVATYDFEYLDDGRASVAYPWLNGEKRLFNVFPLPERQQSAWRTERLPNAWTSANPPELPTPPLAVVPPAALPSERTDADAAAPTEGSAAPSSAARDDDEPAGERAGAQRDSEKAEGR